METCLKLLLVGVLSAGLVFALPTVSRDPDTVSEGVNTTAVTLTGGNETTQSNTTGIMGLSACNEVDEIVSNDPCKPLCACKDRKIFCADIMCTTDSLPLEHCWKLPLNGKCCPSYLCSTGNATGDVHYPLPVLVVPPELNLSSIPPSKAELLHRTRRPGSQP
ncbi:hypothetical protein BV898_14818 [Hypsibius exemplaris]|uniref:VWFC domain-containing protein n=1 Tax=Hypsibius exemplaris TaxID=2072580 RepID=A0A9X6NCN8_HYPEX|nr:hypothetical protein BV898_14818 [Hypsibius exemplaris]